VSDPDHERYGQHLSADEVDELVAPSSETHLVHDWLQENGIDVDSLGYSSAKDWIVVHLPIEMVETLLDAEYHNYKHKDGSVVARTTGWSLPRHLHSHIDTIQPTTSFFRGAPRDATWVDKTVEVPASYSTPKNSSIAAVCNVTSVTPECFQTLYKTKGYKTQASDKNGIGFTNYLGEIPIRPDTKMFLQKYRPEAVSQAYAFSQISVDGGPVQDGPLTLNQSADAHHILVNRRPAPVHPGHFDPRKHQRAVLDLGKLSSKAKAHPANYQHVLWRARTDDSSILC
jgi:tripeptidyl-peptidase-1